MPKVLVIDDEAALTIIISRFLEDTGFEVETATSGSEGLEKAISLRPDAVILDIMMPDMDGYQVCRQLRQDPRTAQAVVMALTARGQPVDKQTAFHAGVDAHVTKPFKGQALVQEVRQLLADRVCASPPLGYQILVLRLKEGVGATTVATNLGVCLAQQKGCQVVVADMAFKGGQVKERMGLSANSSWTDASTVDEDELATHLLLHNGGPFVLPAPSPAPDRVAPAEVRRLLRTLRGWHDYVVLDSPLNLGSLTPSLFQGTSLILLVLTPEPTMLRNARASLSALKQAGDPSLQIWPILNMVKPGQESLQLQSVPIAAMLPLASEACAQATAKGKPIVLDNPGSPLATAIHDLAEQIVDATSEQTQMEVPG
jgi:CheY-like chemotaxis protein/MinD-like ATPase involved in chromosome partitioning or flagellar assembly